MTDLEARGKRLARRFILNAVTYLVIGAALGVYMGATRAFQFAPVHAHLNLLGWASMALAGLIYDRFPAAGGSRLGLLHFWMHNLVLPAAMITLFASILNVAVPDALMAVLAILLWIALFVFALNLYQNLKTTPTG